MKSLCFISFILCNFANTACAMDEYNKDKHIISPTHSKQEVKHNNGKRCCDDSCLYSGKQFFPSLNLVQQTWENIQNKDGIDIHSSDDIYSDLNTTNKRQKLNHKSTSSLSNTNTHNLLDDKTIPVFMSELAKINSKLEIFKTKNRDIIQENVKLKRHLKYVNRQYENICLENSLLRNRIKELAKELKKYNERDSKFTQDSVTEVFILNAHDSKINVKNIFS